MKNRILLIISVLISTFLYSQNKNCGFNDNIECETKNQTIEHSFKTSDIIIEGTVINIDTVSISKIIEPKSISKIKNDTLDNSQCAKSVLKTKKVIKVKVEIKEIFKSNIKKKEIYIMTPLKTENSGYSGFKLKNKYVIYASQNKTADIYFFMDLRHKLFST